MNLYETNSYAIDRLDTGVVTIYDKRNSRLLVYEDDDVCNEMVHGVDCLEDVDEWLRWNIFDEWMRGLFS